MSVMKVTNSNYTQEVLESNVPVLIDFFADWCMPCKMFAPIVDEVAAAHEGKVKVVKINIDDNPGNSLEYRVMSIPTLKLVDAKEVKGTNVGAMSKAELESCTLFSDTVYNCRRCEMENKNFYDVIVIGGGTTECGATLHIKGKLNHACSKKFTRRTVGRPR